MPTPPRIRWTRDQLLVVLNLYHKIPFGKISSRQPVIIDLAKRMGRTPASISMKLGNLASFDPVLKLRGIVGLPGASNLDREMWDEFHQNPAEYVPLSQQKFDALFTETEDETTEVLLGIGIHRAKRPPEGETETTGVSKRRRGQDYFREIVLNNYGSRCAVTGLPVRPLLIASHILPWAGNDQHRLNVRNGICLNRLHDAAFDQGLIAFDDGLRLVLSTSLKSLLPQDTVQSLFAAHEGNSLLLPEDAIPPDAEFLANHRNRFKYP